MTKAELSEVRTDELAALLVERDRLRAALQGMIDVWEGPRERAAVGFAAAVVQARAALNQDKE